MNNINSNDVLTSLKSWIQVGVANKADLPKIDAPGSRWTIDGRTRNIQVLIKKDADVVLEGSTDLSQVFTLMKETLDQLKNQTLSTKQSLELNDNLEKLQTLAATKFNGYRTSTLLRRLVNFLGFDTKPKFKALLNTINTLREQKGLAILKQETGKVAPDNMAENIKAMSQTREMWKSSNFTKSSSIQEQLAAKGPSEAEKTASPKRNKAFEKALLISLNFQTVPKAEYEKNPVNYQKAFNHSLDYLETTFGKDWEKLLTENERTKLNDLKNQFQR